MRGALALLLLAGAIVAIAMIAAPDALSGVSTDDVGRFAYLAVLGSAALLWMVSAFRGQVSRALEAAAFWLLLFVVLIAGHSYRYELQAVAHRVAGDLIPGRVVATDSRSVEVRAARNGFFAIDAEVNGRPLRFLFDTGASTVVLTAEDAARIGLHPPENAFTVRVSTANGNTTAAPVTLRELAVGPIAERDVTALVARPGALATNLLGHSFLDRLASYEVRGDRLSLRGR